MDLSTVLLIFIMASLFLAGAGFIAALVVLERRSAPPAQQDRSPAKAPRQRRLPRS